MSHEIYYTSAPEGLKRGTSGFSTVAASDNIPKALWDRLEALSAYRHHFGVRGSGEGASGPNPVSQAHWILTVAGKTHHVLSRICDSGVDHTQRTNAFAHHLVLDGSEMEAAAGGPAWLLGQPGVMTDQWDGRVGSLTRATLPGGEDAGRVCRAWAALTGDAGWGGHLADLFVKSPARPVCILFSPGQDLFPLIAEAVALLPPAARWNVTFNTYFTSMPTSATCLWRCCLAGTPAAQVGLRYAAGGLILDLTQPGRLPELPAGPLVTAARTGQLAPMAARPVAAPAGARPARNAPAAKIPPGAKTPPQSAEIDDDEEQLEQRRASVFEFTAAEETQIAGRSGGDPYNFAGESAAPVEASRPDDRAAAPALFSRTLPSRSIRRADDALLESQREAEQGAARRRKQVVLLVGAAIGAMALGTLLIVLHNRSAPPPVVVAPHAIPMPPKIVNAAPLDTPDTHPAPAVVTQPVPPPETTVVKTQSAPPPPPPPIFPDTVTLTTPIERPNVAGIGDRIQSFALPAADIEMAAAISALALHFPSPPKSDGRPPSADTLYASKILGTFNATVESHASKPGITLSWKSTASTAGPLEIAVLSFDRARPGIDLQWHTAALLKNPDLFGAMYWLLQNSTVELFSTPARNKNQRIRFKPVELPAFSLTDSETAIPWPAELPRETVVTAPRLASLPAGWEVSWAPEWDVKDPVLRSPANSSQVLKFRKATSAGAIDAFFLLTFRPGLTKVESTLTRRMAADQADLTRAQSDMKDLDAKIDKARTDMMGAALDSIQSGRDLLEKKNQARILADAYTAALAAYHEITAFDIAFDQPDGVRLATIHFVQKEPGRE